MYLLTSLPIAGISDFENAVSQISRYGF